MQCIRSHLRNQFSAATVPNNRRAKKLTFHRYQCQTPPSRNWCRDQYPVFIEIVEIDPSTKRTYTELFCNSGMRALYIFTNTHIILRTEGKVRSWPRKVHCYSHSSFSPSSCKARSLPASRIRGSSTCFAFLMSSPASSSASISGRSRNVSMPKAERKCFVVTYV